MKKILMVALLMVMVSGLAIGQMEFQVTEKQFGNDTVLTTGTQTGFGKYQQVSYKFEYADTIHTVVETQVRVLNGSWTDVDSTAYQTNTTTRKYHEKVLKGGAVNLFTGLWTDLRFIITNQASGNGVGSGETRKYILTLGYR